MFESGNGLKRSPPNFIIEVIKILIAIKLTTLFNKEEEVKTIVDLSETGLAYVNISISVNDESKL